MLSCRTSLSGNETISLMAKRITRDMAYRRSLMKNTGNYGFGFASLFIPIILRSGRPSAGPPGRCAPR